MCLPDTLSSAGISILGLIRLLPLVGPAAMGSAGKQRKQRRNRAAAASQPPPWARQSRANEPPKKKTLEQQLGSRTGLKCSGCGFMILSKKTAEETFPCKRCQKGRRDARWVPIGNGPSAEAEVPNSAAEGLRCSPEQSERREPTIPSRDLFAWWCSRILVELFLSALGAGAGQVRGSSPSTGVRAALN